MRAMAKKALFLANRTAVVTMQSTRFADMAPEEIALWSEKTMLTLSNALGAPDMRDQNIETQIDNILESIATLNGDRKFIAQKTKSCWPTLRFDKPTIKQPLMG